MISRFQGLGLALLILADTTFAAVQASKMPSEVPVHWNIHGDVDSMGSPWELAFVLPATLLFTVGLLLATLLIGSVRESLQRSGTMYGRMTLAAIATMVVVHVILLLYWDHPQAVLRGLPLPLGALLAVMGNWMGKIRRNPVMGIRTPWTLKSDYVWERTHRIGGRIMVAHGIAIVLSSLLFPLWSTIAILVVGLIAQVSWAMIYSASLARAERRGNDAPPTAASTP